MLDVGLQSPPACVLPLAADQRNHILAADPWTCAPPSLHAPEKANTYVGRQTTNLSNDVNVV